MISLPVFSLDLLNPITRCLNNKGKLQAWKRLFTLNNSELRPGQHPNFPYFRHANFMGTFVAV